MPLFRFKEPPAHLVDATYLFDENPDLERYAEVEEPKPKSKTKPATEDPEGA